MELMYQENAFMVAGEDEEEAMIQHVSVAAAVMRLERGVALMELNGTQIVSQMAQDSDEEDSTRGENVVEQQPEEAPLVSKEEALVKLPDEQWEIEKPNEFLRFFLRMGFGALLHPYEYAKVLMQLGHEPLPAIASKNLLGRSTLSLPSVHEYIRFIKHTDGFIGLYRGLGSRFLSCASAAIFAESLVNTLGMWRYKRIEGEKHALKKFTWNLLRDGIVICTGLIFSHPFYVISVRQMGQFVGREVAYTGICGSFREIVRHGGIMGFYAGFVPRLLCDLGVLLTTSTLSAICNRTFHLRSTQKEYNSVLFQFAAIMIFYPLQVAGACMACSGSGLAAGAPPFMPIYAQWTDCLMDLFARGDQLRGAFIFRRALPRLQMQRAHDVFPISRMV